jgi:O-antigen/teichoic acid export membrane protein
VATQQRDLDHPPAQDPAQDPPAAKSRRFGPGLEFNALALMASTAITAVVGLGFWALAARLPAAEVGRASAVISTATMLSQLAGSNIGLLFSRVLPGAGVRSRKLVLTGYGVSIAISVVLSTGFLLLFPTGELFGSGLEKVLFPLMVVAYCLFALQDWVLTGIRVTKWVPVEQLLFAVLKLGLLVWFAAMALDGAIVWAWALPCAATVLVINPLLLLRTLPRRPPAPEGALPVPPRRDLVKIFFGEYATGAVAFVVPMVVPLLVLTQLGPAANAYYALPLLIAESGLGVLIWNISSSYMVEASHDNRQIGPLMTRTFRLSFLVVGAGTPFLLVFAPWILSILGPDYAEQGTSVLRLMALAIPFMVFSMMFINTSRVQNRMRRVVGTQLMIGTLMIVLTVTLLPIMGVDGAGWAYLIAEASGALVGAVPLYRFMRANDVRLFRTAKTAPDADGAADDAVDDAAATTALAPVEPGAIAATTPMSAVAAGTEDTVRLAPVPGNAGAPNAPAATGRPDHR